MKPMLARTYGPKYNLWPAYVQPKLNGVRALYQRGYTKKVNEPLCDKGVFQSRDEKLWSYNVLKHLFDELQSVVVDGLILDGELYVHSWRLQRINSAIAVNRHEPTTDTPHVQFHVFDVVDPKRNFSERYLPIANLLREANLPHIRAVDTALVHDRNQFEQYFSLAVHNGYEGAMLRPDGVYEFGEHYSHRSQGMTQFRSKTLWKHKSWEDGEFCCVGVEEGIGKRDNKAGALILATDPGTLDSSSTFKVGTGFDDDEASDFLRDPPIGKLIRIRYQCLTADGIPFNPSFLAVLS